MGVLNVTPDSFSDGGEYLDPVRAVCRAERMAAEGADIIDIGGESSRPGSKGVSAEEELERVMPVIRRLKDVMDVPLSVDTCKSAVAFQALSEGVSFINDITALRGDAKMARVIAGFDAGVILMHMKGRPRTMQDAPYYDDIMEEILSYLGGSITMAADAGIGPERIIVDPGIGFGKSLEHNLAVLRRLQEMERLDKPILVGASKKSFIGALTGRDVGDRIFGTAAAVGAAILNGADIVRVHDVGAMKDVARVIDALTGKGSL